MTTPKNRAAKPRKPKHELRNSYPVAWGDWSDDAETTGLIQRLVGELGISLRLTGAESPAPGQSSPSVHQAGNEVEGVRARKRGRPPVPKLYSDVAFRLLLNLFRVVSYNPTAWIGYSCTEGDYTKHSQHLKHVSYTRVLKVVKWFEEAGWIVKEPGYFNWIKGHGRQSLLQAAPALIGRLAGMKPVVEQGLFTDAELIWLKDADKKPFTNYPVTDQLKSWMEKLRRINTQIARSRIDFALNLDERQQMFADLLERKAVPDFSRIQLYRSFNDGQWDRGGRFYGGWWINLPSKYREHITIDGEATVEPDFSAYHISLIYSLEGHPIPESDLYDIGWAEEYRDLVKKLVNALLYADSAEAAYSAAMDFREDGISELWEPFLELAPVKAHGKKSGLLIPMHLAIMKKHAKVAHRFGQGDSTRLQFKDSEIAETVLMWGVTNQITILPVHDSFIVPAQYAALVEKMMRIVFDVFYSDTIRVK